MKEFTVCASTEKTMTTRNVLSRGRQALFILSLLATGCHQSQAGDQNTMGAHDTSKRYAAVGETPPDATSTSWAQRVPYESIQSLDALHLANGAEPVSQTIRFPAVKKDTAKRVVLRFRARLDNPTPAGWNYFLGLKLNGKEISAFTANGTPRLLNRAAEVQVDEGRPNNMSWWGQVQSLPTSLLTFFAPDFQSLDNRVKTDRDEGFWYVIDISDLVNYHVTGLDDLVLSNEPNELTITNSVLYRFVANTKTDLVIDDFSVGTITNDDWMKKVGVASTIQSFAKPVATLRAAGYEVKFDAGGAMQLQRNGDLYNIESLFSYPGEKIGYNAFALHDSFSQHPQWKPVVRRTKGDTVTATARCADYEVQRSVSIVDGKIRVRDTFKNLKAQPTGIIVENAITAPTPYQTCLLGGAPEISAANRTENPSLFVKSAKSSVGILIEDNALRLQTSMDTRPNRAAMRDAHFALPANGSYTMEWTLYPQPENADYWTFINQVRRDWKVNFTIQGPWTFFHVQRNAKLLDDPVALRAYLKRKNLKIVAMVPWLDYDNMNIETNRATTRAEYTRMMQHAIKAFRQADLHILLTGCLEVFPFPLSLEDSKTLRDRLPADDQKQGYPLVTKEMLKGLKGLTEHDLDAVFCNPDGKYTLELYYRGNPAQPMAALVGYPAWGNAQHKALMEQAKFLIKDVGLDGIYVDSFSSAYDAVPARMRYDYGRWDNQTVDIDAATGQITRRYTDAGLAGATARADLVRYVLKNAKVFVANGYPVVRETQSLPTFRFSESEYNFDPLAIKYGEEPPYFYRMTAGHLSSPIGLGYRVDRLGAEGDKHYAEVMMKTVITYLRHGALTYHYQDEIPETGPGAGEYGPFNHMYPITPISINPGWIEGKERSITCVSHEFLWHGRNKPNVLLFDIKGRVVPHQFDIERMNNGWKVNIKLQDWQEIAVIEE